MDAHYFSFNFTAHGTLRNDNEWLAYHFINHIKNDRQRMSNAKTHYPNGLLINAKSITNQTSAIDVWADWAVTVTGDSSITLVAMPTSRTTTNNVPNDWPALKMCQALNQRNANIIVFDGVRHKQEAQRLRDGNSRDWRSKLANLEFSAHPAPNQKIIFVDDAITSGCSYTAAVHLFRQHFGDDNFDFLLGLFASETISFLSGRRTNALQPYASLRNPLLLLAQRFSVFLPKSRFIPVYGDVTNPWVFGPRSPCFIPTHGEHACVVGLLGLIRPSQITLKQVLGKRRSGQ